MNKDCLPQLNALPPGRPEIGQSGALGLHAFNIWIATFYSDVTSNDMVAMHWNDVF